MDTDKILHAQVFGEGIPFVILHGFLGMSDNWKTLGLKYAEVGYEVHLLDLRNHGRSFHSNDFTYDIMTEDLYSYCQTKNLSKIVLLGHSMGGKVAMKFAVEHPEMIQKLLIADIGPKAYPPHHQDIINALLKLDLSAISSRKEADDQLAKDLSNKGVRQFLLKNLYRKNKTDFGLRMNLKVLSESMEAVGEGLSDSAHYEGETLFLKGEKSDYIVKEDEEEIKTIFPKAEIETISGAGHWIHAENPEEFYEKTIGFLR